MARSGESSGSVLAAEMAGIDINSDVSSCGDVTGAVTGGAGREIDVVPSARRTSETAYVGDGDGGPAEGGYGSGTGERETYDGASTGGASSDSNPQRYAEADYWDERYGMDDDTFDWLIEWSDFERQGLPSLIPPRSKMLVLGCGNSTFQEQCYDSGVCTDQHLIDLSSVVIRRMSQRAARRPGMKFYVMNVRDLDFGDDSFDVVLDKSTMDCLFCCEDSVDACRDMVCEGMRVLKPGGTYICISLHGHTKVLSYLHMPNWTIRYFSIPNPRYDGPESGRSETHTVCVCRKLLPGETVADEDRVAAVEPPAAAAAGPLP